MSWVESIRFTNQSYQSTYLCYFSRPASFLICRRCVVIVVQTKRTTCRPRGASLIIRSQISLCLLFDLQFGECQIKLNNNMFPFRQVDDLFNIRIPDERSQPLRVLRPILALFSFFFFLLKYFFFYFPLKVSWCAGAGRLNLFSFLLLLLPYRPHRNFFYVQHT